MGAAEDEDESMRGSRGGDKIFVSVRLRPLNDKEIAKNDVSDWECISDETIIYRNNLPVSERSMYPTAYSFDRVFRPDCSTRKVYEEGAKEVAIAVVSGINSSVFAYGQTSSGKTYTMSGITGYAVADIYDYIEQHREREFALKFSAMEIYNESVRDLLSTDTTPLRLLDDPERGTVVERITEETLRDWDHFRELLSICEAQRQIGETALNETSSRSHQILRLTIESSACEFLGNDKSSSLSATVNFIDLAGSERASQTSSAGARLKEGCHINRSLLTLGTVIRKLSKGRNGHIPFRDSKLTRILQSSLGGNAKTAIICTMSPARTHVEQSRNTLLFASCAKEVATNARVNVVVSDKALVKQLQRELTRMGEELRSARPVSVTPDSNAALREKDLQIEKLRKQVSDLSQQLEEAHSQVEDLLRGAEEDRSSRLWEGPARHYPRLRVRNSCISDISASYSFISEDPSSVGVGEQSFNASLCSDRQSIASSDENFVQLAHFVEDFRLPKSSNSSPDLLSTTTADVTGNDQHENVVEEETYENSDNNCKEVQCISEDQPNTKGCANSDMSQYSTTKEHENSDGSRSSQNRYPNSNVSSPDREKCVSELMDESKSGREEEEMKSPSLKEDKESSDLAPTFIIASPESKNGRENEEMNSPSLKEEKESSDLAPSFIIASPESKNGRENEEMNSSSWKEEKGSSNLAPTFIIASPEKPSPEKPSPWVLKEGICRSKSFTLTRSRSCRARLVHNLSVTWSEKESIEGTPPFGYEKDFIGRPESSQRRLPPLKYDHNHESLSRADSQASISTSTPDLRVQTPEALTNSKSTTGRIGNGEVTATDDDIAQETDESRKDVKDVGLDPIKDNMKNVGLDPIEDNMTHVGLDPIQHEAEDIQKWPSEFKRMQREIIQLWHACNVSLVHRSYFFLLFKGDASDSFYMEVEHRRLCFLKDTFSRGTKTMVDGLALTPASSERGLSQERQMLAREMQRALSKTERENLFLRWGISMSSNNRRLQVVHCLWSKTNDMNHIAESATLVAKIVGFEEQESGMKQMLGLLNISPLCLNRRRTSFWKRSVFSFL